MQVQDRAELVLRMVQFYKLLVAQRRLYPQIVIQAAKEITAQGGPPEASFTRTL